MSKFGIFRNSKHNHPAIEIEQNLDLKRWKSVEMTHSPKFKKDRDGNLTNIPKEKFEKFVEKPINSKKRFLFC